jgi:hypothetical protein
MSKSKTIQNQASSARRTATSINKIIEEQDWEYVMDKTAGISKADRAALVKASAILSKIGSSKSRIAKTAKTVEVAREQAIAQAEIQAKAIISEWEKPSTVIDKITLVIAAEFDYSLETYLRNGIPVWSREVEPHDWLKMLDELVADSLKNIPSNAAYHAVDKGLLISDVMLAAKNKLDVIKKQPKTIFFAKEWTFKIFKDMSDGKSL